LRLSGVLFGTIWTTRQQNKHKAAELQQKAAEQKGEWNFKARVWLFEIRRRRWEQQRDLSLAATKELADYLLRIPRLSADQRLQQIPKLSLRQKAVKGKAYTPGQGAAVRPLIESLSGEERQRVEETLSVDVSTLSADQIEDFVLQLAGAYSALDAAQDLEMEIACEKLFGPFLDDSKRAFGSLIGSAMSIDPKRR
jgi:hypothetical protein